MKPLSFHCQFIYLKITSRLISTLRLTLHNTRWDEPQSRHGLFKLRDFHII